jgi:hypothetical protein
MGMVSRGADLEFVSQYPAESEILFGPLSGVEVQQTRVDGTVVVVEVALSVNMVSLTIEQVVGKMQGSHQQLVHLLHDEIAYAGAPGRALVPLKGLIEESERADPTWFNDPENFHTATREALAMQRKAHPPAPVPPPRLRPPPASPHPTPLAPPSAPSRCASPGLPAARPAQDVGAAHAHHLQGVVRHADALVGRRRGRRRRAAGARAGAAGGEPAGP